jgi:inner membrane protein
MAWWAWVILGCLLVLAETLTPGGFYIVFFGTGALVVGMLDILGWAGPAWLQWLLFSAISLASLAFFRKPLLRKFSAQTSAAGAPAVDTDRLVGEIAVASESIASGAIGRVEMRGAAWNACNQGAQALASGQRCVVEHVEGLMLSVRAR